jgi:drug/metabolite transporter (DMT)-like permease
MPFLWVIFTLCGAVGQTARNAMQRELTPSLGADGATLVRFLFGFPFAVLFLAATLVFTHQPLPTVNVSFAAWVFVGASTQIAATALMLLTMEQRSFVVTVAYLKIEPVLVAVMGLMFLGDRLTFPMAAAILMATAGVSLISIKPNLMRDAQATNPWKPAALGLSSGALFAASAIGYRGAILALAAPGYLMPATFSLVVGLTAQTLLLMAWLLVARRGTLVAILKLWRPSLLAGFAGGAGSEFWFLAFALATAASVRTLALVEVLFAQTVSRFIFRQKTTAREAIGIALLLSGAALIVWAS